MPFQIKTEGLRKFRGQATDVAAIKLPPEVFAEDKGGDLSTRGSWRRRRGMRHLNVAKVSNPITSILGFSLLGGTVAILAVDGANAQGYVNTAVEEPA